MFKGVCVRSIAPSILLSTVLLSLNGVAAFAADTVPATFSAADVARNALAAAATQMSSLQSEINSENVQLQNALLVQATANAAVAVGKSADVSAKQAASCRLRANVQAAFTGGLALKPAPYGVTYVSIAALLVPFFFPDCNAQTATDSPQTADAKKQQTAADAQVQSLQASISRKKEVMLQQYQTYFSTTLQQLNATK